MSAVVIIPLENNKEISALVADMQPGDKLYACGSIKALDAQTLTLRIEEVTNKRDDLPKPGENDEDKEDDAEEESNGSTPGESEEAAELAASGGYNGP